MTDVTAGGPTVRRMLVGAGLRRLRTEAGISREQAGEAIRASVVTAYESGLVVPPSRGPG